MASKKQESTIVTERRLRPIYDCLDISNNKKALQEAEKLLKKQPDLVCAKALRALALIRLSRTAEAMTVLTEIEQQDPDEEYTLQALTYCYRDLGRSESIIALYERATKKHPQNEEFLSHLMMAYVRVGEYKRQNHIAMQLYKLRPTKNPYYFWSVMSTVMQAYDDPKLARTMYLPLAERMIGKFLDSDKLNAEAEVKLYVLILEMQEKYAEAVAVLQGDLMARFVKCMWESNQKVIELLEKLQRWQEIYNLCENRLPENTDDWFVWTHLFSSGFELIKDDATRKLDIIEKLTTAVLSNAKTDGQNTEVVRGPYLARLRLIACLLERDFVVRSELGTSPLGEPSGLLLDYFRRFGDKPCLFDDVKPYLWLLGEEQQNDFIGHLENVCGGLPVGAPSSQPSEMALAKDLKQMMRHQSALQLARCLGRHANLSSGDKQRLAIELVGRYEAALDFGADLLSTEMQPADGYLLLALHTIWDLYVDAGDNQFIFEMLLLAEQGLKRSPSNFRFKSLLMKLYSLVGGGLCVLRLCESMDVKYVLRETLWYHICDQLTPWGLYADLAEWSRTSLTFYALSEKEIVDCVVQCYKSGSFPKIVEFFDFRKKLRNSFHYHACQVWRRFFTVINDGSNIDYVVNILKGTSTSDALSSSFQWSSFGDNCDYSVVPVWETDETMKAAEVKRQEFYQQHIDQLRFYQLVLSLLSLLPGEESSGCCPGHHGAAETNACQDDEAINGVASINIESGSNRSAAAAAATIIDESFSTILSELRAHCRHCANNYSQSNTGSSSLSSPILNSSVSGFFAIYLTGNYLDVLVCVLESIFAFVKSTSVDIRNASSTNGTGGENDQGSKTENENQSNVRFPSDQETQDLLKAMFSTHQLHGSGAGFPFMQMCHVSFLVQTLSVALVAFTLTVRRVRSMQHQHFQSTSKDKKQKKKKAQQAANVESVDSSQMVDFLRFAAVFCQAAETTLQLAEDLAMLLETDVSLCSLNDSKFAPPEFCATKAETASGLRSSYKHSIKELQRVMTQNLTIASSWCRDKETKRLP